ncbi:MAG: SUMF1/EgtB/PvdO family nonheme iron enzyme [Xanthomonadales bacterium]|nr:SUMF1/EgtB/PvdO family nonheme iron enzyme [Xanthomonadales bacterium]
MIKAGETFGKYQIVRQLGAGGMSDVFEAIDTTLERSVALKVLPLEFSQEDERIRRFRKEVLAVAALDHPGIVTIFEVQSVEGYTYYAMSLLPNGNLKERIRKGPMEASEALRLIRYVAGALGHAHENGIIHRDIKPENILFARDGHPVLADFGIVKMRDSRTAITAIGTSVGTPYYMSPEQAQATAEVGTHSDVYSLGVVLYEMLTGDVPYDAPTAIGIALMHVNDPLPRLPDELSAVQPLLDRMLAKKHQQRLADTQQLVAEIDTTLGRIAIEATRKEIGDPTRALKALNQSGVVPAAPAPDPEFMDGPDPAEPAPGETGPEEAVPGGQEHPEETSTPQDPVTEFELMAVTPAEGVPAVDDEAEAEPQERKAEPEPARPRAATPTPIPEPRARSAPPRPPARAEEDTETLIQPGSWRSDELYQKEVPPWYRRPVTYIVGAIAVVLLAAIALLGGDDDPSPLDLITGTESEPGAATRPRGEQQPGSYREEEPEVTRDTREAPAREKPGVTESELDQLLTDELMTQTLNAEIAASDSPDENPGSSRATGPQSAAGPGPRAPEQESGELAEALVSAAFYRAAGQLAEPAGENAWDMYSRVLEIDPGNSDAVNGRREIRDAYLQSARNALDRNEFDQARGVIATLQRLAPDQPDTQRLADELAQRAQTAPVNEEQSREFSDPLGSGRGPVMVRIPGGRFDMGSSADPSEQPIRSVEVRAFSISKHEVTVGQFETFVTATGYRPEAQRSGGCNFWLFGWRKRQDKSWGDPGYQQSRNMPVVCVTRGDAEAYAGWLTSQTGRVYKLPSEAQWEFAARNLDSNPAYWESPADACRHANVSDRERAAAHSLEQDADNIFDCTDGEVTTANVGSFLANEWGLHDMLGNAAEWVADCWEMNYASTPVDGSPMQHPVCDMGVVRGGSWYEQPSHVRVSARLRLSADQAYSHIGFRLVRRVR